MFWTSKSVENPVETVDYSDLFKVFHYIFHCFTEIAVLVDLFNYILIVDEWFLLRILPIWIYVSPLSSLRR